MAGLASAVLAQMDDIEQSDLRRAFVAPQGDRSRPHSNFADGPSLTYDRVTGDLIADIPAAVIALRHVGMQRFYRVYRISTVRIRLNHEGSYDSTPHQSTFAWGLRFGLLTEAPANAEFSTSNGEIVWRPTGIPTGWDDPIWPYAGSVIP
ncbi:MAG TPA: hypothetical protein PKC18_18620, partial [Lacipirellulaceae bacterium]|nr:hypothetical protein [Lacipirellulaceae bacterium]